MSEDFSSCGFYSSWTSYYWWFQHSEKCSGFLVFWQEVGIDWIIHLDTDELLHPAGAPEYSLQRLLNDVAADVDMVVFPNYVRINSTSSQLLMNRIHMCSSLWNLHLEIDVQKDLKLEKYNPPKCLDFSNQFRSIQLKTYNQMFKLNPLHIWSNLSMCYSFWHSNRNFDILDQFVFADDALSC